MYDFAKDWIMIIEVRTATYFVPLFFGWEGGGGGGKRDETPFAFYK